MKRAIYIYALIITIFMGVILLQSFTKSDDEKTIKKEALPQTTNQVVRSLEIPPYMELAGEEIPVSQFDVKERLNRELLVNTYWHSSTVLNFQKASRYFPIIERILAEEGVPDDLKYLAVAESSLRNTSSPAGAKGIWQFMKTTARSYGMEVNSDVDERYHLEKATRAACKYLKASKNKLGSWAYAMAAYNMGEGGLKKQIRNQKATNYYDLNLNAETARYVFRIAAIKEIMKNPEKYGFYISESHKYKPLDDYIIMQVNGAVENWGNYAKKHGVSYRMLKIYNPWLVNTSLANKSRKKYKIRLPKTTIR